MSITKRIDAITSIGEGRLVVEPPAPRSAKIEITGRCNYRCAFCAHRAREGQAKPDLDLGLFKRITREMHDAGVREFGLFYLGESFLASELLIECIRYLRHNFDPCYIFLTTNGSLASSKVVADAMRSGLDSLKWSVNHCDQDQFEEVSGVSRRMFELSLKNLKEAYYVRQALDIPCGLYASSILYDEDHRSRMEPFLDLHVRPFVDEHYWLPLYSMGSLATETEHSLGWNPGAGNQGRLGALREPLPCWAVFTEAHVTSSGLLSACCFDANDSWIMADLGLVPFMEGWHSKEFRELRAAHLRKDVDRTACAKCIATQVHR